MAKTYRTYERSDQFQRKFFEACIERGPSESLYEAFRRFAKDQVGRVDLEEARAAYGKKAPENEREADVLLWIMAGLHRRRFEWAYANLFKIYGIYFRKELDLVFWGCGCGIDLLALYDQIQKGEPGFWAFVRSVIIIEPNAILRTRALKIAEVLFPLAQRRIRGVACDWRNLLEVAAVKGELVTQSPSPYVPRIHILSYVVGFSEDSETLGRIIKDASGRHQEDGSTYYNEVFYAFSPDSGNVFIPREMATFKSVWKELASVPRCAEGLPRIDKGVYMQFHCLTFRNSPLTKLIYSNKTQVFSSLLHLSLQKADPNCFLGLMRKLSLEITTCGVFRDVYKYVRPIKLRCYREKNHESVPCDCLLFAPEVGFGAKACLIKLGQFSDKNEKIGLAKAWLQQLVDRLEPGSSLETLNSGLYKSGQAGTIEAKKKIRELMGHVIVLAWDAQNNQFINSKDAQNNYVDDWKCAPFDQHALFGVFAGDQYERLPTQLNGDQREIAYGRRRQRLVRGGPGTGKTLTLLHHAVSLFERTGLPVLVVSKTHSLGFHNSRRLAATYLANHEHVTYYDEHWIRFITMGTLMCELARWCNLGKYPNGCLRESCKECLRLAKESNSCGFLCRGLCCDEELFYDLVKRGNGEGGESGPRRLDLLETACEKCRQDTFEIDQRETLPENLGERSQATLLDVLGGVLVDEAQLFEENELRLLYSLSERMNRWREFYLFADEEQAIRSGYLEKDTGGKLVVKPPAKGGFGRWKTLKGNHRVKSRALLGIYRKIQQFLAEIYDVGELDMELPEGFPGIDGAQTNVANVFRIQAVDCPTDFEGLCTHVDAMRKWIKSDTLVIVADSESFVRSMGYFARQSGWIITHLSEKKDEHDEREEKELRMNFLEKKGRVHLTTIDCAQGRTFDNVLFLLTRMKRDGAFEEVFTGMTRAASHLQVLDCSPDGWLYSCMVS